MPVDKYLQIYDENGNPVDYDIRANDVKFQDGEDLPTKIAEMEQEIEDAGGYEPPAGGIPKTDLAQGVQDSLDAADSAYQKPAGGIPDTDLDASVNESLDKADTAYQKPASGIPSTDMTQAVQDALEEASSALQPGDSIPASDVTDLAPVATSGSYNDLQDTPTIPPGVTVDQTVIEDSTNAVSGGAVFDELASKQDTINDLATIQSGAAAGATALQESDVYVESQEDGTFDINVRNNKFSINLNHEHENMAKLVVCEESDLPSTLEKDTIYCQVDEAEDPAVIEKLWIAGLEFVGGGEPDAPTIITPPLNVTEIELTNEGSGWSKTITIRAKNLTDDLAISFDDGTYFTADKQSISPINGMVDTTLTITCSSSSYDVSDRLIISDVSDGLLRAIDLISNKKQYEDLAAVKFTGSQWLNTGYYPNAATEFSIDLKFTANSQTQNANSTVGKYIMHCVRDDDGNGGTYKFEMYTPNINAKDAAADIMFMNEKALSYNGSYIDLNFSTNSTTLPAAFSADHNILAYVKNGADMLFSMNNKSHAAPLKTATMLTPLKFCMGIESGVEKIFGVWDITIYRFTITENGNTVRDWVPRKRLSDNAVGLYDLENDTFIKSASGTELEAIPLSNS